MELGLDDDDISNSLYDSNLPETATSTSQPSLACDISPVTPVSVAPGPSSDTTSAMPAQGGYIYELF